MPPLPPFDPAAHLGEQTRRHFFSRCAHGPRRHRAGLAARRAPAARGRGSRRRCPIRWRPSPATTRRGPRTSSTCSWPAARASSSCSTTSRSCIELNGQPIPPVAHRGQALRLHGLAATARSCSARGAQFTQHGQSGAWVSELFPHTGEHRRRHHARALVRDGSVQPRAGEALHEHRLRPVRPAEHGLVGHLRHSAASRSDLPGFVVLQSGPRGPRGGAVHWGSGFLPTTYQGVPFRGSGDPILNLSNPAGVTAARQRQTHRRRPRPEPAARSSRPATRRSPRASPPTRWPTACRPARRS